MEKLKRYVSVFFNSVLTSLLLIYLNYDFLEDCTVFINSFSIHDYFDFAGHEFFQQKETRCDFENYDDIKVCKMQS